MKKTFCHFVCYASPRFQLSQVRLIDSLKHISGPKKVHKFGLEDVAREFQLKHADTLRQPRGAGYWLWKPYFVNKVIQKARNGEVVFYCDSGACLISDISPLLELVKKEPTGILSFDLIHPEKKFTKRIAFVRLGLDAPEYTESVQRLASFVLFHVSDATRAFVKEWLEYSEDLLLLTGLPSSAPHLEAPEFIDHRHDQSIFSLLCKKHQIPGYPDPSEWGNEDPRRPAYYGQLICHDRGKGAARQPPPKESAFLGFRRKLQAMMGKVRT